MVPLGMSALGASWLQVNDTAPPASVRDYVNGHRASGMADLTCSMTTRRLAGHSIPRKSRENIELSNNE